VSTIYTAYDFARLLADQEAARRASCSGCSATEDDTFAACDGCALPHCGDCLTAIDAYTALCAGCIEEVRR
jgi:hypothetical protein